MKFNELAKVRKKAEARWKRRIYQKEIAKEVGVSTPTICLWESKIDLPKRKKEMYFSALKRIEDSYGLS